jgi:hypothetical protein
VELPKHVRAVHKKNRRTYYYFEKFRRTAGQWPRVRLPATPLSEEFARRIEQLPRLEAVRSGETWSWSFLDVSGRRHTLPAPADYAAFWAAVDKAEKIGKALAAGERKTFSALIVEFKDSAAYTDNIAESTREQYDRCMDAIEAAWGDDPVASLASFEIQKVLDKAYRDTPAAGRVFRSTLGRIISWGIARGYRNDNPVEHTERIDSDGTYSPWPPEAFDIFFEHVRVDLAPAGLFRPVHRPAQGRRAEDAAAAFRLHPKCRLSRKRHLTACPSRSIPNIAPSSTRRRSTRTARTSICTCAPMACRGPMKASRRRGAASSTSRP